MQESNQKQGRLLTVNQFVKEHPWPPIGGLRWLIFHEKSNGFNKVVVRIGRRVLLDVDAFYAWAKSNGQRG